MDRGLKHDEFASIVFAKQLRNLTADLVELRYYEAIDKFGRRQRLVTTKLRRCEEEFYEWSYFEGDFEPERYLKWMELSAEKAEAAFKGIDENLTTVKYQTRARWYFENGPGLLDHQALSAVIEKENSSHNSVKRSLNHFLNADLRKEFEGTALEIT